MTEFIVATALLIFLAILVQYLRSKVRARMISGDTKNLQKLKDFMLFCSLLMTFLIFVVIYLASQLDLLSFGFWSKLF